MGNHIVPALVFDFLTPLYDPIAEILGYGSTLKEKVIKLVDLKDGEDLLDVGCGTGSLAVM